MALLKIARMGNPVLLRRAEPVADPADAGISRLIDDMLETMLDARGVGLAAPQVHRGLRLFVYRVPAERTQEGETPIEAGVLINPELELIGEERVGRLEGCLSIPGLRGLVPRAERVRYRGLGRHGDVIEGEAGGFFANVLQHEYDHLDGILYPSRMVDASRMGFEDEVARFGPM